MATVKVIYGLPHLLEGRGLNGAVENTRWLRCGRRAARDQKHCQQTSRKARDRHSDQTAGCTMMTLDRLITPFL